MFSLGLNMTPSFLTGVPTKQRRAHSISQKLAVVCNAWQAVPLHVH